MTILLAVVLVYTVLGGMVSVLVTDYIQFLVMGLGIVVTSVLVIWDTGWTRLVSGLWRAHETGAVLVEISKGAAPARTLAMADPFNPFASFGWDWLAWQWLVMIAGVTTWQPMIARVLSARDSRVAKQLYRRSCFYFVGRFALPGLWGAGAFLYFLSKDGLPEGVTSKTAMPMYLGAIMPTGIIGVLLAAMLAAEMSTDSGYLLTWATVIYNDLIMPCLRRPLSDKARLLIVRLLVAAIGVFLVVYGLWYEIPGTVWNYLTITGTIYEAGVLTLLIGALYWPKANHWGAYATLVLGAAGPLAFVVVNSGGEERIPPAIAGLSGFGLAFAGMLVGSLLGRALEMRRAAPSAPAAPAIEENEP
jgi:SSS family solute:Na+ symporter